MRDVTSEVSTLTKVKTDTEQITEFPGLSFSSNEVIPCGVSHESCHDLVYRITKLTEQLKPAFSSNHIFFQQ